MQSNLFAKDFWARLGAGLGIPAVAHPQGGAPEASGRDKFSMTELERLYDVLEANPTIDNANRSVVVETIRSIAEFIIWGDQNEPMVFEFSMEQNTNMMSYLSSILSAQAANRSGSIAKQVLQSLSIIIQNISSETGIHFLFSQGHLNVILQAGFDFEDEEVLGLYISLLKAISIKLGPTTSQLFVEVSPEDGTILGFPLYTQAVLLAHHKEGMVRAGSRTALLNILSVADPYIDTFITRSPATEYLRGHVDYLAGHIRASGLLYLAVQISSWWLC